MPPTRILLHISPLFRRQISLRKQPFLLALRRGDVARGGTSVITRQKFHTDEVKYLQNPVMSADWTTE